MRGVGVILSGMAKSKLTWEPRDYQLAAAKWALEQFRQKKRPLIVMPTGAGKTRAAATLIALGKFKHPVSLSHTCILRDQLKKYVPSAQSLTLQGFLRDSDARRRAIIIAKQCDVLFVDEAHHIASTEYQEVLQHFRKACVFGMTATPERSDQTGLGDVFDSLWQDVKYSHLIARGLLVKCDLARPAGLTREDLLPKRKVTDGVDQYLKYARRPNGKTWRPGIYFDRTVALCQLACSRFNKAGVRAAVINAHTEVAERVAILEAYRLGHLDMLCSPIALAEGFDMPRAEVCVLRRSACHISTYLQCVGRVLRPYSPADVKQLVKDRGKEVDPAARISKKRALLIDSTLASDLHELPTNDRTWELVKNTDGPASDEDVGWRPDYTPPQPFEVIFTNLDVISDGVKGRIRHYEAIASDRFSSKSQQADYVSNKIAKDYGIHRLPATKNKICSHCHKRINVGSHYFWEVSQGNGLPHRELHEDCWIAEHSAKDAE